MSLADPFPDPREADEDGLVAVGGDFTPDLLLAAYRRGIFPWPAPGYPFVWYSPDPRAVLVPEELHVPRRLRKTMRRGPYRITFDTAFERVLRACATAPRPGEPGTWIVPPLIDGYVGLHRAGYAHSVEAWDGSRLVGGLYGVAIGAAFCGESMFHLAPDASKLAFVALVERLREWGFRLVDCQIRTDHLARFGAREWPRERFLAALASAAGEDRPPGSWREAAASAVITFV